MIKNCGKNSRTLIGFNDPGASKPGACLMELSQHEVEVSETALCDWKLAGSWLRRTPTKEN